MTNPPDPTPDVNAPGPPACPPVGQSAELISVRTTLGIIKLLIQNLEEQLDRLECANIGDEY